MIKNINMDSMLKKLEKEFPLVNNEILMILVKDAKEECRNLEIKDEDINNLILTKSRILIKSYISEKIDEIGYSNFVNNFLIKNTKVTKAILEKVDSITRTIKYDVSFEDYENLLKNEAVRYYFESKHNLSIGENELVKNLYQLYCISNDIDFQAFDEGIDEQESVIDKYNENAYTEDSVATYLRDINKIPLLSKEEEKELAIRIKNGDSEAKEKFINANLRLVISVAKYYRCSSLSYLDLIQEGNIGLMKAVDKFDPSKGYKFSTYARWWILQSINRSINTNDRTIRLPEHIAIKLHNYKKSKLSLADKIGRIPTYSEISEYLNIPTNKVLQYESFLLKEKSLNSTFVKNNEESAELVNFVVDDKQNVEDIVLDNTLEREIEDLLRNLDSSERDIEIVKYRFGFKENGGECLTLNDIGNMYGITRERVRQIEEKTLSKIKSKAKRRKLKMYLEN